VSVAVAIEALRLDRFRNLVGSEELRLDAPLVVFTGENGEGKTNALEAVHYLATLKPLRGRRVRELVRFGEDGASVAARVRCGVVRELRVDVRADARKVSVDGKAVSDLGEYFATIRAISFQPSDAEIVSGEPARRRNWLDRAAFTAHPVHLERVRAVRRVLDQKQALLRTGRPDRDHLDVLDEQLAWHGAELVDRRAALLDELRPHVELVHDEIAGGQGALALGISTQALGDTREQRREALRERLHQARAGELERRTTRVGPQLDDVVVSLDGRSARDFGSRGQIRSIVLALKLGELGAAVARGVIPAFLLDDLSSELDAARTRRLVSHLLRAGAQVLATTTDPEPLRGVLPASDTLTLRVRGGVLTGA
jgi:DNA replication and repair protein RecF